MMKIERKGDWGSYDDVLDGKKLQNGELVIVKWPGGKLQQIQVTVIMKTESVSDHGKQYDAYQHEAYWSTTVNTIPVLVPLLGLEAQRAL